MADRMLFPPTTMDDIQARGWEAPDFVYVIGDAYVDHPSFGSAVIYRTLEAAGYRVAVLAQPDWHQLKDFKRFGRPNFGFLVSSGVIDSMVNHYTAAKRKRHDDVYTPGGKEAKRPDRAVIVYCKLIREAYGDIPIAVGGVEGSLRRFAHYDYWDDKVRPAILHDCGADLLMFGMGERSILRTAEWMSRGAPVWELNKMRGVCYMSDHLPRGCVEIPSYEECLASKKKYGEAFLVQYNEQDPVRGHMIAQKHGERYMIQSLPDMPLSREELDESYELPYQRTWHPDYDALGGVPAIEEVQFSIAHTRGCFGSCAFCAITFHQGRMVTTRSHESVIEEAKKITEMPNFKGYIHDIGGPTANFRHSSCDKQWKSGTCVGRQCLFPRPCPNLKVDHTDFIQLLREVRSLPKVKKVFVRSGLRYDYIMADKSDAFLKELCEHHISGQLKVAPEHVSPKVLAVMGKPGRDVYDAFCEKYRRINEKLGKKQYLVPYLISSHPGSDLEAAIELAEYLRDINHQPEQVQDFYPTPGTLATCMFYTGFDPRNGKPVFVARTPKEKAMQRALLQFKKPQNFPLVREALREAGREDLIGTDRHCLVPPEGIMTPHDYAERRRRAQMAERGAETGDHRRGKNTPAAGKSNAADGKNRPARSGTAYGKGNETAQRGRGGKPSASARERNTVRRGSATPNRGSGKRS